MCVCVCVCVRYKLGERSAYSQLSKDLLILVDTPYAQERPEEDMGSDGDMQRHQRQVDASFVIFQ